MESIDIPRILSQQGGEAVYPLPRIKTLEVHPKLNLAALIFAVKNIHFTSSVIPRLGRSVASISDILDFYTEHGG